MAMFILMGHTTDAARLQLSENPRHIHHAVQQLNVRGAQVLATYALIGPYDYVMLVEADDTQHAARLSDAIADSTRLRLQTMPVISASHLEPTTIPAVPMPQPANVAGASQQTPNEITPTEASSQTR